MARRRVKIANFAWTQHASHILISLHEYGPSKKLSFSYYTLFILVRGFTAFKANFVKLLAESLKNQSECCSRQGPADASF